MSLLDVITVDFRITIPLTLLEGAIKVVLPLLPLMPGTPVVLLVWLVTVVVTGGSCPWIPMLKPIPIPKARTTNKRMPILFQCFLSCVCSQGSTSGSGGSGLSFFVILSARQLSVRENNFDKVPR